MSRLSPWTQQLLISLIVSLALLWPGLLYAAPKHTLMQEDASYVNPLLYGAGLNSTTLNATIVAIGTDRRTIMLTPGAWTITDDVTVPLTITFWVPMGVTVAINNGITLTLNGPTHIDNPLWYSGAGTLVVNYRDFAVDAGGSFFVSGCTPSIPGASLTLAAFACRGNINSNSLWTHAYQVAAAVGPLNAGNGEYWIAFHRDTTTAVSGWVRQGSTHYLWQFSATQPVPPTGGALFAGVTVAAGAITNVEYHPGGANPRMPGSLLLTDPRAGGKCDGVTDDSAALMLAHNLLPTGGTLLIPRARCVLGSTVTFTKNINMVGQGPDSVFWLTMGTATDGLVVDPGGILFANGLMWRDFSVFGAANSAKNCLVLRNVNMSRFQNVHVRCGTGATGYGVWLQDFGIENFYHFIINLNNTQYLYGPVMPGNGVTASTTPGNTAGVFNANQFDLDLAGLSGSGLYIHTSGDNGNNDIRGTYQSIGFDAGAAAIYVLGGQGVHLHDIHSEAYPGETGSVIVVQDHAYAHIGPAVFSVAGLYTNDDVNLENCYFCVADGVRANRLKIGNTSEHATIGHVVTNQFVQSTIVNTGTNTHFMLPLQAKSNQGQVHNSGEHNDAASFIINGDAERWDTVSTIPPGSWRAVGVPSWGRQDTIVKHGLYSASVTYTDASRYPALVLFNATQKAQLLTQWITVSGWIYIPAAGGSDVIPTVYWAGGAATHAYQSITSRDTWTHIVFSTQVGFGGYDDAVLHFIPSGAYGFYLDAWSVVPSLTGGPVAYAPNPDEYKKFDRSLSITSPGLIAANTTVVAATVSVPGALANDLCLLGPPAAWEAGIAATCFVVSTGNIQVRMHNVSAGGITPATATWVVGVIRRP